MAAGLGSRYGGVKQIERVGPCGEILMEYAIYDAVKAGFNKIVIIITLDMLDDVKELFGDRIEKSTGIAIDYAFQDMDGVFGGIAIPKGRGKPLGTVHAVLCAREYVSSPFAVINADDYYGGEAFRQVVKALPELGCASHSAMVAYLLKNTVSPYGTVTRGVCKTQAGVLRKVVETYKIRLMEDGLIRDTSAGDDGPVLDPDSHVSMNLWAYHPDVLRLMEDYFVSFLRTLSPDDNKSECLLPVMMDAFIASGSMETAVLSTSGKWFGLTYKEDKPGVCEALSQLHASGEYPPSLWV